MKDDSFDYREATHRLYRMPNTILRYRLALFGPDLERYVEHRLSQGYKKGYLCSTLQVVARFHRYLLSRGVQGMTQVRPDHLESYRRYQIRKFGVKPRTALRSQKIAEHFLQFAFQRRRLHFGPIPPPKPWFPVLPHRLIKGYLNFCRLHKNQKSRTGIDHQRELWRLGQFLNGRGRKHVQDITLQDLEAYCVARAKHHHAKMNVIGILRSFMKYLFLEGALARDVSQYIQSPCRFHVKTYPKYLPWPQIRQLLHLIDRRTAEGLRYYAIILLMACHGLRPREVAGLRMEDIDWKDNSLFVRARKNGSTSRLPLSLPAKQALQDYLSVRSNSDLPEVFLTHRAPIKPFGPFLCDGLSRLVVKHLGPLPHHRGGAYALRHSFAKALLDQGATIPEIGAMLGHRSLHATNVYLRIDTRNLREVSDNYASLLFKPENN